MLHPRIFQQAALVALIAQIVWATVGLFPLPDQILFIGRLGIAVLGGYLYGKGYDGSAEPSAFGGVLVGAVGVLPAIFLSVAFGNAPGSAVPVALGACMLAGGGGGWLGYLLSDWRRKELR